MKIEKKRLVVAGAKFGAALFLAGALAHGQLTDSQAAAAPPDGYAIQFVSTAAFGSDMNAAGDVIGTSYADTGCGSTCLPPLETVVWRGGERIVLPALPSFSGITVVRINSQGWIVGFAGVYGTTHAVVWKPVGSGYEIIDLGTLPGANSSGATGIDDEGRVVGWSSSSSFPPGGAFMWTETGGLVDLAAQGYPSETPKDISPNGNVVTANYRYVLGDPASVTPLPAPPQGFFPPGGYVSAINDNGDMAHFLPSTSTQNLVYPFRLSHTGIWQQLSLAGTGHLAPYGLGSITNANDVTATTVGAGVIAYGPNEPAQGLGALITPAYGVTSVTQGGPQNDAGQILTKVVIGQSQRLVRLAPATACTTNCIRVNSLAVQAKFITPSPGQCVATAYNSARVTVTVTDENGVALSGVTVSGRLLDDYWTNAPFSGRTNRKGMVSFRYTGPACVGALAFIVESASRSGYTFDNTTGVLTAFDIPQ